MDETSQLLRRVISETDDHGAPMLLGNDDEDVDSKLPPQQQGGGGHGTDPAVLSSPDGGDTGAAGAAVIEPDSTDNRTHSAFVHVGGVPLAIRSRLLAEQELSSSSLSEDEGGGRMMMMVDDNDDEEVYGNDTELRPPLPTSPTTAPTTTTTLPEAGADSVSTETEESMGRTGSQNSSRDWGWFEDVHQSLNETGGLYLSRGVAGPGATATASASGMGAAVSGGPAVHPNHKGGSGTHGSGRPKKKRGLVPQVSGGEIHEYPMPDNGDASAMAVTAPNYVLEESLSSQRLWKQTAGQRPPQPAEERAFYEKMWAQNFARSKVHYGMPVEVLTATSPISLSPFFDANFNNSDIDYATASAGVQPSAPHAATAVAEAALQSRLHHPHAHHPGDHPDHHPSADAAGADGGQSNHLSVAPGTQLVNRRVDGDLTVLIKGDNVFGTTVSKSFARHSHGGPLVGVDTVNISVASFRVVERTGGKKYAQFLVVYREGSIRDTVGVWKRYSDFQALARKVAQANEGCAAVMATVSPLSVTEEPEIEHLPNAVTSWRLLKKRQRWYRCLDAGYLSLKVFLLERFLHDILFESSSPKLLRDFVGATDTAP